MIIVLADFLKTGIDKDHFARIHTQIEAADIYARHSVYGRAMKYGEGLSSGLTIKVLVYMTTVDRGAVLGDLFIALTCVRRS